MMEKLVQMQAPSSLLAAHAEQLEALKRQLHQARPVSQRLETVRQVLGRARERLEAAERALVEASAGRDAARSE
eukprot:990747-Lingulodinium_polyedra.AAC.1